MIESKSQYFEYKITLLNKDDLLVNISLSDSKKNNFLIGNCDFLIPYTKLSLILKNSYVSYNQQIQLRIDPNIKFLDKSININNIYLDFLIEISQIENNISLAGNKINKSIIYENKEKIQNKLIYRNLVNNYIYNDNDNSIKKLSYSKSPMFQIYKNFYNNDLNKAYSRNKKNLDINYNVINNNFMNYISTDNNNYFINYDINKPNHIKLNSPGLFVIKTNKKFIENSFNEKENSFFEEEYQNKINNNNQNIGKIYNISEIENENEKKHYKYNIIEQNNENNDSKFKKYINYENDINNKDSLLYKKKFLQKYINIRLSKKISSSPFYIKFNKSLNKENSPLSFHSKINLTENFDVKNFSISKNTNKKDKISISSVLNYFNYVKPFVRIKIKKNIFNKSINKNEKLEKENINKNEINNYEITQNYNQNDLKEKIIKIINDNNFLTKEIKQKIKVYKKLIKKYFLFKEKYYNEIKKQNSLSNNINIKQIKYQIHVNINSKLNQEIYLNMKNIKMKEFYILEKLFKENKINQEKKKIKEKLEQQKKFHILIKIIRELIKNYDNLSQLYNGDEHKKILFNSLLVRYGIREKEENKDINLIEKFEKLKQSINVEKNKIIMSAKKREMENDIYKNPINEEDSEEVGSSISGKKSKSNNIFKKLSWCSEDSIIKEKEFFGNNIEYIEEEENILNSPILIVNNNNENDKNKSINENDNNIIDEKNKK